MEAWAAGVPGPLLQDGPSEAVQEPPVALPPAAVRPAEADAGGAADAVAAMP